MPGTRTATQKKGRVTLSISQDLLDRLEPYKEQINLSAQAEATFSAMLEHLENRAWVERNHEKLIAYGEVIRKNGLAGEEFERI